MLNFLIFSVNDPYSLAVMDITKYEVGQNPVMTLEVTAPGYNRQVLVMKPSTMMLLNAPLLQIDCDGETELPDGLYYLKLQYEPVYENYLEKYYYRTDKLEAKLDSKLLESNLSKCGKLSKQERQGFEDAYIYLRGAKAAASACDYTLAERLYRLSDKTIDSIKITKGGC